MAGNAPLSIFFLKLWLYICYPLHLHAVFATHNTKSTIHGECDKQTCTPTWKPKNMGNTESFPSGAARSIGFRFGCGFALHAPENAWYKVTNASPYTQISFSKRRSTENLANKYQTPSLLGSNDKRQASTLSHTDDSSGFNSKEK